MNGHNLSYMQKTIQFPFMKKSESNLVVRIVYRKTHLFYTNMRCPILIFFETISVEDFKNAKLKPE